MSTTKSKGYRHIPNVRIVKSDGRKFNVRTTTTLTPKGEITSKHAVQITGLRPAKGKPDVSVLKPSVVNNLQEKFKPVQSV